MTSLPEHTLRTCTRCGLAKRTTEFYARSQDTLFSHCKACHNAVPHADQRYKARPLADEQFCGGCERELPLSDFSPRGDGLPGVRSRCRECRRDEKRRYRESHREQLSEYQSRYYRENAEAVHERVRRAIAKKPDYYRESRAAWRRAHPDAAKATAHKRYARQIGNGGSWTQADWQRVKARYDWRCLMCGRQEMTDGITLCFDHIVPLSLGGWNIISNAQPLCKSCNSKKHRKVLDLRPDGLTV